MIDRSYLPFQSARDYQDPGMQKWMGFFLSEHTSSLGEEKNRVDFSTNLNSVEKLLLLSQLYIGQLKGCFVVKERKQKNIHKFTWMFWYTSINKVFIEDKCFQIQLRFQRNCQQKL